MLSLNLYRSSDTDKLSRPPKLAVLEFCSRNVDMFSWRLGCRPTIKVSDGGGPRRSNSQMASARRHSLHCLVLRKIGIHVIVEVVFGLLK
jgi:hypothetical protein